MEWYHDLLHRIGHLIGHEIPGEAPAWLHPLLHVVLMWTPTALVVLATFRLLRWTIKRIQRTAREEPALEPTGLPKSAFQYILRYSLKGQVWLIVTGLVSLPILYATLELPKIIINEAIGSNGKGAAILDQELSQTDYLFLLSGLYLIAVLGNGTLKYFLNVYKGKVGERLLRRLRLKIFHRWRRGAGSERRSEVIPLLAQEVEPIGGFASDAFALPVFQGGTFVTILTFMFVQDPYLGAAAITLLPVQVALIPRLQRRINLLTRRRVAEIRALGGHLGDQAVLPDLSSADIHTVGGSLKTIEAIRRDIHRTKFFMKALNNFLTALTPFFFYSIGGYLVIAGQLSLGALVAVLAAYKDFSAPLRELFRYYQSMEDVRIRYEEVQRFLASNISYQPSARITSLALQTSLDFRRDSNARR